MKLINDAYLFLVFLVLHKPNFTITAAPNHSDPAVQAVLVTTGRHLDGLL